MEGTRETGGGKNGTAAPRVNSRDSGISRANESACVTTRDIKGCLNSVRQYSKYRIQTRTATE